MADEPWQGDACSLVEAFRRKERSPREELDATLAAIERSELNAFSFLAADDARRQAGAADTQLPRTGIPIERERILSSAMIVSPLYGTRASTVLCVTRDGSVCWEERSVTPEGAITHTVRETFRLG